MGIRRKPYPGAGCGDPFKKLDDVNSSEKDHVISITNLNEEIVKVERAIKAYSGQYGETDEKVVEAKRKLEQYKAMLVEVTDKHVGLTLVQKEWAITLDAQVNSVILSLSKNLEEFNKEISLTLSGLQTELSSAKNELDILLSSEQSKYKLKLDLDVEKLDLDRLQMITVEETKISKKAEELSLKLESAKSAIEGMGKGTDTFKTQLDTIMSIQAKLLSTDIEKKNIVGIVNDLFKTRTDILKEQYRLSQQERTAKLQEQFVELVTTSNNFTLTLDKLIEKNALQKKLYQDQYDLLKGKGTLTQLQIDLNSELLELETSAFTRELEINSRIDTRITTLKSGIEEINKELANIIKPPIEGLDAGTLMTLSAYLGVAQLGIDMDRTYYKIEKIKKEMGILKESEFVAISKVDLETWNTLNEKLLIYKTSWQDMKKEYDLQNKAIGRITTSLNKAGDHILTADAGTFTIKGNLEDANVLVNSLISGSSELANIEGLRKNVIESITAEMIAQNILLKERYKNELTTKIRGYLETPKQSIGDKFLKEILGFDITEKTALQKEIQQNTKWLTELEGLGIDPTSDIYKDLKDRQDYLLENTTVFWTSYGDAIAKGTAQVISTLS